MHIFRQRINLIILSLLFLSNCTPARIVKDDYNPKIIETEKVRVVRRDTVIASLVPAIFGYDGKDKVELANGREVVMHIPTGEHEFFIRSNQADRPKKVLVNLEKGQNLCFYTKPNDYVVLKGLILPWYYLSSAFDLIKSEECYID